MKRQNYISWDAYFMFTAKLASLRSKDPVTQVGAVLVNSEKRIVGVGYNGFPSNLSDDILPWGKTSPNPLENKYLYVCHAEVNAILNSIQTLNDCTMYVTHFPCAECTKMIVQSKINKIIYLTTPNNWTDTYKASERMLQMAGITYQPYNDPCNTIQLTL